MHDRSVKLEINLTLLWALVLAFLTHALALFLSLPHSKKLEHLSEYHRRPLQVRELKTVRTVGDKNSKLKDRVLITKDQREKEVKPNIFEALAQQNRPRQKPTQAKPTTARNAQVQQNPYRPAPRPKALDQLMQRQEPVTKVASQTQSGGAAALAGSPTLSKSLMNMQVEVPEGVKMDELNEFELMFYGFQKRMMEKYVNAIMLNVRDYEKRYSMPVLMPEGKHVMTGRVTFDSDGNIKQIKMLRWTQADKLQAMFEDILKSMMTLPNPPKMLRNPQGEFVVFYTFTVNNT